MNMFAIYHGYQQNQISVFRFFLLKILKTAYHSARPRFYKKIANTSMFITYPIYCTIFVCVRYKLIIVTVSQSVKSKESPLCYNRALRSKGILKRAGSEHIQHSYSIFTMVPSGRGLNGRCYHRRVRIFNWGGGDKSHAITSLKIFEMRHFLRDKDIVKWKIRGRGLVCHATRILLKKEDLK